MGFKFDLLPRAEANADPGVDKRKRLCYSALKVRHTALVGAVVGNGRLSWQELCARVRSSNRVFDPRFPARSGSRALPFASNFWTADNRQACVRSFLS